MLPVTVMKSTWLKLVCLGLIALVLIYVFYTRTVGSPVPTPHPTPPPFDINGKAADDPQLIAYIKSQMIPPSDLPYNLRNPDRKDFAQLWQTGGIKDLFHEKKNGFFIEVGGFDGETFSNSLYWERELGWTGLLIEPDPENFRILQTKNRKAFALQGCLSPTEFANVVQFKSDGVFGELGSSGGQLIEVPCYPLYSIIAALDHPTIDFFSLDIEGWELTVLKTIPFKFVDIHILMVEYNHIKEGFDGLREFLENKGYELKWQFLIDGIFRKKNVTL